MLEQKAGAAVGGNDKIGGLRPAAVELGLLVLAVEKHHGEATVVRHRADAERSAGHVAHARAGRPRPGKAAS